MRSFGTITHDAKKNLWVIKTEPHVAIRIKRMFPKVDARQHKNITLTVNPETSRDIEWLLQRFPHEVNPASLLTDMADQHKEQETVIERLLAGVDPLRKFDLKLPARDYQWAAAQMWDAAKGFLLGDDVGTGKTLSALCGLTYPGRLPGLVVTLTHLPTQWESEIAKFVGMSCHILRTRKPYDITKYCDGKFPDIVIGKYSNISGWAEVLGGLVKTVVFDEGHELRHSDSDKYAAAKHIADLATYKIMLTATPLFNLGGEMYNLIEIIRPGAVGTREEFIREWCRKWNSKPKLSNPDAFGLYLREQGIMLRRTCKEVGRELPPVVTIPHMIDADLDVLAKMEGNAVELAQRFLQENEAFKGERMSVGGQFDMKLRQATGVAKAPYCADFIKFLHAENPTKIVVFAYHHAVYDILAEKLKDLKPVFYTGRETPTQKKASLDAFINGDSQVIIISLRSAVGLDGLQKVSYTCVTIELDWSESIIRQNVGRVARDGQMEVVKSYFLISSSGSDPIVSDILGVKKPQLDGINDPNPDIDVTLEVEPVNLNYVRNMAISFLKSKGIITEEEVYG